MKLSYATKLLALLAIGGSTTNGFQMAHYRTPNNMFSTTSATPHVPTSNSSTEKKKNSNNAAGTREMTTAGGGSDQNESAKALSDYMAKAHEDKLRAIKEVETSKSNEIKALKAELAALKAAKEEPAAIVAPAPAPAAPLAVTGDVEELTQKLESYQKFMAKYIVEAQDQKLKAVKAAEAAMAQKYEQKLLLLGSEEAAAPAPPAAAPAAPVLSKEQSLYASRNAKVAEAAKAGKSRWGDQENARAAGSVQAAPVAAPPVAAADVAPVVSKNVDLFNKRNAAVAAAGKAGMSRWGVMEIAKASGAATIVVPQNTATPTVANGVPEPVPAVATAAVVVPPEVAEADHGLRAEGSVGGLSLAERVSMGSQASSNIGATIIAEADIPPEVMEADHGLRAEGSVGGMSLAERVVLGSRASGNGAAASANVPVLSQQHELFNKRTATVAAAGQAGKSRWGPMEVAKALGSISNGSSAAPAAAAVPASSSVNLGAQLLGA